VGAKEARSEFDDEAVGGEGRRAACSQHRPTLLML
jgi:hypothetical protein